MLPVLSTRQQVTLINLNFLLNRTRLCRLQQRLMFLNDLPWVITWWWNGLYGSPPPLICKSRVDVQTNVHYTTLPHDDTILVCLVVKR